MSLEIGVFTSQSAASLRGMVDLAKHTQPNSALCGIYLGIRAVYKRKVWSRIGGNKESWDSELA